MSKINETNYPRRTQANYADTDMLVLQAAGGNTYTTRIEDMRDDYEATLAPTIDKINDALAPAENGATASQAYAAGEHFMRDGAYCTAIGSGISSGGSFTLNTNYKTGTVADDVESLNSDLTSQELVGIGSGTGRVTVQSYQAFKWNNLVFLSVLAKVTGNAIDNTTTIVGVSIGGQTVTFNRVLWSYFSFTGDAIGSPSVSLDSTNKYLTQQASSSIATNSLMQIMAILELP